MNGEIRAEGLYVLLQLPIVPELQSHKYGGCEMPKSGGRSRITYLTQYATYTTTYLTHAP